MPWMQLYGMKNNKKDWEYDFEKTLGAILNIYRVILSAVSANTKKTESY
jgi:hypothetical protein